VSLSTKTLNGNSLQQFLFTSAKKLISCWLVKTKANKTMTNLQVNYIVIHLAETLLQQSLYLLLYHLLKKNYVPYVLKDTFF